MSKELSGDDVRVLPDKLEVTGVVSGSHAGPGRTAQALVRARGHMTHQVDLHIVKQTFDKGSL